MNISRRVNYALLLIEDFKYFKLRMEEENCNDLSLTKARGKRTQNGDGD